jgi:hypothetical protein
MPSSFISPSRGLVVQRPPIPRHLPPSFSRWNVIELSRYMPPTFLRSDLLPCTITEALLIGKYRIPPPFHRGGGFVFRDTSLRHHPQLPSFWVNNLYYAWHHPIRLEVTAYHRLSSYSTWGMVYLFGTIRHYRHCWVPPTYMLSNTIGSHRILLEVFRNHRLMS